MSIRHTLFIFLILSIALHFLWLKKYTWQLPTALIQQPVLIQGVIASIPEKKFHGVRFLFQAEKIDSKKVSATFLISWYQHPPILKPGQMWQFITKLKPPIGLHNPGGFDYQAFLESHHISATGYVMTQSNQNKLLTHNHFYFLNRLREKIHAQIVHSVPNQTIAAFISALCVGLRDGLTESDWQVFQNTGTNHLVAIAGLHIGFVVASIYFLVNYFIRFFPTILLKIPASTIAEIAALFSAVGYTALSGFALPAQRASIMLFCFMVTRLCYLNVTLWQRFFFAAIIILLLDPFCIRDMSFWLSFSSIAILAWVMQARLQFPQKIMAWLKMQSALTIGLLPIMLLFFQKASLISFLANAIAIPWIGFFILPLVLLSCMIFMLHGYVISAFLFSFSEKLLLPLWHILLFFSRAHFAAWHHIIFNPVILVCAMIGVIFLLSPKKFPAKWLGCFGLLPLFFYTAPHPKMGEYWVSVIDVGQGLSVLVQTAHHTLLYDTGSHIPGGFDMGESVVTPYLHYRGIAHIDRLEISHGDNDHSGGADAIVKNFNVAAIFTSAPKLIAHFHAQYCAAGQTWNWDGVNFITLNPAQNAAYEDNNSSCVIKIAGVGGSILLAGDIQRQTENDLLASQPDQLHATVLLVPHHGSKTSSSDNFLNVVSPHYAIISAGKYNHYHLPSSIVLDRYQQHHVTLYNTADFGAVFIRFLSEGQVKLSHEKS